MSDDTCGGCGGPYRFDTSIPSVLWNAVIRPNGGSEFLCATCILREFVKAGRSFTATLWGDGFMGQTIEIVVGGAVAQDAAMLGDENNRLRGALRLICERADAALSEATCPNPTP